MRAQHEEVRLRSQEINNEIKEEPEQDHQPDTIEKDQHRQFVDETAQIEEEPVQDNEDFSPE